MNQQTSVQKTMFTDKKMLYKLKKAGYTVIYGSVRNEHQAKPKMALIVCNGNTPISLEGSVAKSWHDHVDFRTFFVHYMKSGLENTTTNKNE